jgi:hypothetical protein
MEHARQYPSEMDVSTGNAEENCDFRLSAQVSFYWNLLPEGRNCDF